MSETLTIEQGVESKLIVLALNFAITAHMGQTDKAGKPYILHPLAVWSRVRHESTETQIAAILHDTVEDTPLTLEEIRHHFGDVVATAVRHLTRAEGEQYFHYVQRAALNPIAAKVKKADLLENSSPERVATLPEEMKSIVGRYHRALRYLESHS